MESIISSYKEIAKTGTANINYMTNLPISYNPNWSEETKAYYDLLITQQRTGWGFFTATLPDGRMPISQMKTSAAYTKLADLSDALDYNFDILPTYQHIAWGRDTKNTWLITCSSLKHPSLRFAVTSLHHSVCISES